MQIEQSPPQSDLAGRRREKTEETLPGLGTGSPAWPDLTELGWSCLSLRERSRAPPEMMRLNCSFLSVYLVLFSTWQASVPTLIKTLTERLFWLIKNKKNKPGERRGPGGLGWWADWWGINTRSEVREAGYTSYEWTGMPPPLGHYHKYVIHNSRIIHWSLHEFQDY